MTLPPNHPDVLAYRTFQKERAEIQRVTMVKLARADKLLEAAKALDKDLGIWHEGVATIVGRQPIAFPAWDSLRSAIEEYEKVG